MLVAVAIAGGCADDGDDAASRQSDFEHVSTQSCPDSRFECVTLSVPRDHFSNDPERWDVTFGIQRALSGESQGTFVTITGGPGSSGLALADYYTDFMSEEITDNLDVVFIDQRGIGQSVPLRCDEATAVYYAATWDPSDPVDRDEVVADTRTYADDCVAEAGVDLDDLPYFSTVQAVEDLEAIRQYLGVEQLVLYGESYGTQYVQTYAAAHPDRVERMIIDGVVDLTTDVLPYWIDSARAHDDALTAVLSACDADEACADDAGGDALSVWDELADRLAAGPIPIDYPLSDGTIEAREFTMSDLEWATASYISGFGDRLLLQRAVAAAGDGNLLPLARMAYVARYVDPDTLEPIVDPSWSDAMFLAVECQDYDYFAAEGSDEARIDAWLEAAAADDSLDGVRLDTVVYGDLPCLAWPGTATSRATEGAAPPVRPDPIVDPPYSTLLLTADTDAATPIANAMRVFGRLADASMIILQGGPHVIFDWGYECVDDPATRFIATGEQPPTRVTICDADVADPYVAVAPADAEDYDDAVETALTIQGQLLSGVGYVYWDFSDALAEGCDFGGTVVYEATDVGTDITLDACELTDGYPVTGTGSIDDFEGTTVLDVDTPDGELTSSSDGVTATVTGTFEGDEVDETVEL